jgi:hypothetical protein
MGAGLYGHVHACGRLFYDENFFDHVTKPMDGAAA